MLLTLLPAHAFRYSTLAAASGEKQQQAPAGAGILGQAAPAGGILGQAAAAAKRVTVDWKCLIGEAAVDIRMGRLTAGLKGGALLLPVRHPLS